MDPTHVTPYLHPAVYPQPFLQLQPHASAVRGQKTPKAPWQRKAPREILPARHASSSGLDTSTITQASPPPLFSLPTTGLCPDTTTKVPTPQTGVTPNPTFIPEPAPKKPRKPRETKLKPGTAPEKEYSIAEVSGLELVGPTTAPQREKAEKETKTGDKKILSVKRTKKAQQTDPGIVVDDKQTTVKIPKTSKSRTTTTTKKKQAQEAGETKWKVVKSTTTTLPAPAPPSFTSDDRPLKRPRVWCDSIEELTSAIPPLANITNGISWINAPTPVVFLEDLDEIGVECVRAGGRDVELVMTRDFTCLLSEMDTEGRWDEGVTVGPPKVAKGPGEEHRKISRGKMKIKSATGATRKDDTLAPVKPEERLEPGPSSVPIPIPFCLGGGGARLEENMAEDKSDKEGMGGMASGDGEPFWNPGVPESWQFFQGGPERGREADTRAQAPVKTEERVGPGTSPVSIPIPFCLGGGVSQSEANMEEDKGDKEGMREMTVWDGEPFWNRGVPESWQFFQGEPEPGCAPADSSLGMGLSACGGGLGVHVPMTTATVTGLTRKGDIQALGGKLGPGPRLVPIPIPFFPGEAVPQLEVNVEEDQGDKEGMRGVAVWDREPFWNLGVPESWQFFQGEPEPGCAPADSSLKMGLSACGRGLGVHVPMTTATVTGLTRKGDIQALGGKLGPGPRPVPIPIPFFLGEAVPQLEVNVEEDQGDKEGMREMAVWDREPFWNLGVPESWQFFQGEPERGHVPADLSLAMGLSVWGRGLGVHVPTTTMVAARLRGGGKRKRGEEDGDDVRTMKAKAKGLKDMRLTGKTLVKEKEEPRALSVPSTRVKMEERDVDVGERCAGKKSKTKTKTGTGPSSCAQPLLRGAQAETPSQPPSSTQVKAGSAATKSSGGIKRSRDAAGPERDGDSQGDEARPKGRGANTKKPRKSSISPPPLPQSVVSRVPPTKMTTTTIVIRGGKNGAGHPKAPPETSQPVPQGFEKGGVDVNRQRVVEGKREKSMAEAKGKEKEKEKKKREKARQEKAKQAEEVKMKAKEESTRTALKNLKFSKAKNESGGDLDSTMAESMVKEMSVEVLLLPSELGDFGENRQSPVSPPEVESRSVDVGEETGDDDALRHVEEVPIRMPDLANMEPNVERQDVDVVGGKTEEQEKDDRLKGLKFKKNKKAPTPPPSRDLAPEPVPDPEKEDPRGATREKGPESRPRNEYDAKAAPQWTQERPALPPWRRPLLLPSPPRRHFHYERMSVPHRHRDDDRARPRYNPDDGGRRFRHRDMGWKNKRDVHAYSNGYRIKPEPLDGQDSCWAPQNGPHPFPPVYRRGQPWQSDMSGPLFAAGPVSVPRHQSAFQYEGVPTGPRAMAPVRPPLNLPMPQAQLIAISSDVAGKDGEGGGGGAECAVAQAGLRNQMEVVGHLEDGEIAHVAERDGVKGTLVGAMLPSSPMQTDVRLPAVVPLLSLSGDPKAGGSQQVLWSKATRTLPPPGVPNDAGTGSSQPIWDGEVKEEKKNFPDVQTRVLEVPPATSGLPQPMPSGGVNAEGETMPDVQTQVPKRPPAEVDVLVRAYMSRFPVILVATRSVIHKKWSHLRIPEECEYVYLGCFSVQGVQERRVEATAVPVRKKGSTKVAEAGDVASPTVTGRVEWRFRMRWGASGEEWKEAEEAGQDMVQPWWSGDRKGKGKALDGDSGDEWSTRRFRQAREKQLNYKFKEVPVKELCWGVLPIWMEVVGRRGSGGEESERRGEDSEGWGWWGWGLADESFPSGWHCADCGKVNYQVMFRHRKCSSSFCGGKPPLKTYALGVELLRDPQQNSAMSHPYNAYPTSAVQASVVEWEDGMQTFSYAVKGREDVVVKHIFTGNTPELQMDANKILKEIQLDVPMERLRRNTSPYFSYMAGPFGVPWDQGPQCLMEVKQALLDFARGYGETDLTINHLSLSSWVTTGSKKGNTVFSCIKHSIVIMFLGCEAVLTLVPQSGLDNPGSGGDPVVPMDDALALGDDVAPTRNDEDIDMDGDEAPYGAAVSTPTRRTSTKPVKRGIVVTMVHGDIVVLSGDKFEYSIKRDGTGILLIGECR